MKTILKITLLFISVTLLFSCSDTGSPTKSTTPITPIVQSVPFIPLTIGNHWEYVDSTIYSPDSADVNRYSYSIVGKQKILSRTDSVEVFVFRLTFSSGTRLDCFYKNNPEGLTQYTYDEGDSVGHYSLRSLLLKFPLQLGDQWLTTHGDYADHMCCLSTDTVISTRFGDFHTFAIRTGLGKPSYGDDYYKEGFGRISAYGQYKSYSTTVVVKTSLLSFGLQ